MKEGKNIFIDFNYTMVSNIPCLPNFSPLRPLSGPWTSRRLKAIAFPDRFINYEQAAVGASVECVGGKEDIFIN